MTKLLILITCCLLLGHPATANSQDSVNFQDEQEGDSSYYNIKMVPRFRGSVHGSARVVTRKRHYDVLDQDRLEKNDIDQQLLPAHNDYVEAMATRDLQKTNTRENSSPDQGVGFASPTSYDGESYIEDDYDFSDCDVSYSEDRAGFFNTGKTRTKAKAKRAAAKKKGSAKKGARSGNARSSSVKGKGKGAGSARNGVATSASSARDASSKKATAKKTKSNKGARSAKTKKDSNSRISASRQRECKSARARTRLGNYIVDLDRRVDTYFRSRADEEQPIHWPHPKHSSATAAAHSHQPKSGSNGAPAGESKGPKGAHHTHTHNNHKEEQARGGVTIATENVDRSKKQLVSHNQHHHHRQHQHHHGHDDHNTQDGAA